MLMDFMAAGCILLVAGVMIAMWQFDMKSKKSGMQGHEDQTQHKKGRN